MFFAVILQKGLEEVQVNKLIHNIFVLRVYVIFIDHFFKKTTLLFALCIENMKFKEPQSINC